MTGLLLVHVSTTLLSETFSKYNPTAIKSGQRKRKSIVKDKLHNHAVKVQFLHELYYFTNFKSDKENQRNHRSNKHTIDKPSFK